MTTSQLIQPTTNPTVPANSTMPARVSRVLNRFTLGGWIFLTVLVLLGTQACSLMWAFANPAPHHWDNADYLNLEWNDSWAYRFGGPQYHMTGWHGVVDSLINADHNRPPAYRIAAAPFIFLGTAMLPTLRAVSHFGFWITLWLLYLTVSTAVDGYDGKVGGMIAMMLASLYSTVGWSIRVFGTEYTLYFSVALMLYCFARATRPGLNRHLTWVGFGLAMGIGVLSKLSFVTLAAPAGLVTLYLVALRKLPGMNWFGLIGSVLLGALIAYPWYRFHLLEAAHYGQEMTLFQRHSLNESGFTLLKSWVQLHIDEGMGPGAATLFGGMALLGLTALVLIAIFWLVIRKSSINPRSAIYNRPGQETGDHITGNSCLSVDSEPPVLDYSPPGPKSGAVARALDGPRRYAQTRQPYWQRPAFFTILFALAMGVPLLIFQVAYSQSDNVRHVTPAYFPLTIAVAVLAGSRRLLGGWWSWLILVPFALPALRQVTNEYFLLTTTADDIWDWDPVYQVCHTSDTQQIRWPFIGRVGNAGQFNEASIVYPWDRRGDWAVSTWLWRTEDGPFDWTKVKAKLFDRDLVLTAPGFKVPKDGSRLADPLESDNSHNAEFAQHMMDDPDWLLARKFPIGIVNKAEIWVFVRKVTRPGHS